MAPVRPENADPGSYVLAQCGCQAWTQGKAIVYVPCAPQCENWLHFKRRLLELNMPTVYKDVRRKTP